MCGGGGSKPQPKPVAPPAPDYQAQIAGQTAADDAARRAQAGTTLSTTDQPSSFGSELSQ